LSGHHPRVPAWRELYIRVEDGVNPPRGELRLADGTPITFGSWLELIASLERLLTEESSAGESARELGP
jgi:hypothetical protein